MHKQLFELYQRKQTEFKRITSQFPNDDIAGPLLMSPSEKYGSQPFPLLIVGQETNGGDYFVDDLEQQMLIYEKFNLGGTLLCITILEYRKES